MRVAAIIVAAGKGTRAGTRTDKVLQDLAGRSVLARSVEPFVHHPGVGQIVVVAPAGREAEYRTAAFPGGPPPHLVVVAVAGGERRQDSVAEGLKALQHDITLVAIHDGARPLHHPEVLERLIERAEAEGAAIPVVPLHDTIVEADAAGRRVMAVVGRHAHRAVQTPQVFRRDWIEAAHRRAAAEGHEVTDDASLVLKLGHPVALVEGTADNIKLTTAVDFRIAAALLEETSRG